MDLPSIISEAQESIDSLIGRDEEQDFEAKQGWPDLTVPVQRWEFAKDVAAMANGGGGTLLFGIATSRVGGEQADRTSEFTYVNRSNCDEAMARGILKQHIHPKLENLVFYFLPEPHSIDDASGVLALYVPPQNSKVILCKTMEGSESLKEFIFGFVERDHDDTKNLTKDDVVSMIKNGTNPVAVRLEVIEQQLGTLLSRCQSREDSISENDRQFSERIEDILNDN